MQKNNFESRLPTDGSVDFESHLPSSVGNENYTRVSSVRQSMFSNVPTE